MTIKIKVTNEESPSNARKVKVEVQDGATAPITTRETVLVGGESVEEYITDSRSLRVSEVQ